MSAQQPRVFLSHTHKDKVFVRRLAADLAASGVDVWVDEGEIRAGDSLIERIDSALETTVLVAVVLSRRSVRSAWVRAEVETALQLEIEGSRVKVLPLLLEPCKMPSFLRRKQYVDFTHPRRYADSVQKILDAVEVEAARIAIAGRTIWLDWLVRLLRRRALVLLAGAGLLLAALWLHCQERPEELQLGGLGASFGPWGAIGIRGGPSDDR